MPLLPEEDGKAVGVQIQLPPPLLAHLHRQLVGFLAVITELLLPRLMEVHQRLLLLRVLGMRMMTIDRLV